MILKRYHERIEIENKTKINYLQKLGMSVLCVILIFTLCLPLTATNFHAAEQKERKTVRVGYMIYEGYQEGKEGEAKTGSAYEYLQQIRYYTGWKYEYVYGSANEMFRLLENGDIDILSIVTYTDERAEKYFYSNEPHGSEPFYFYVHEDDNSILIEDYSTFNGKSIGVLYDTYQEDYLKEWCAVNDITANIVPFEFTEDLYNALTNKEIDIIMDLRSLSDKENETPWKSIYRFPSEPLYFAVNKSRPDILEELNTAMANIIATDELFSYKIMRKYQEGTNHMNAYLTEKQQEYVKNCGVLKVGYLDGMNPISFKNPQTGALEGLAADYLKVMEERYGLQFETEAYSEEKKLIEDLQSGELDIILPIGIGHWLAEEYNISLSSTIISQSMSVIYKDAQRDEIFDKIALIEDTATQRDFVELNYPESEIYFVKNTKEALDAVENGDATCYLVRSISRNLLNSKFQIYDRFHTMGVLSDMEVYLATSLEDKTLSVILDKGISLISSADKETAKLKYAYEHEENSLLQAVKENKGIVIMLLILGVLLFFLIHFSIRLKMNNEYLKKLRLAKDEALEAVYKAEKAEQSKTDFLLQMSHDIRTPMNAVIGFNNFINESEDMDSIKQEYIPKLETASKNLLTLINDVLEMSRIESGNLVFQRSHYSMKSLAENAVAAFQKSAEEKGIFITSSISVKNEFVYSDKIKLGRVLKDILSNAIKFTPSGGKVLLSITEEDKAPEGKYAYVIKISDTGIGMSPEFIDKVFEPFERERTSTETGLQGTGLGMAIVKRIIDAVGDTVTVESELGKGTTFTLNVTLQKGEEALCQPIEETEAPLQLSLSEEKKKEFHGKRLLLAEDNEFNSLIAESILQNAGFIVDKVFDGKAAVEKVTEAPEDNYYDLILMDVHMPIMDGYEATRAIRALSGERAKIKIIALTANAYDTDFADEKEAGMDGHLSKPLDINRVYKVLLG